MGQIAQAEAARVEPVALDPRGWVALAMIVSAPFMAVRDWFVVNVAIPTMFFTLAPYLQIGLHFSALATGRK